MAIKLVRVGNVGTSNDHNLLVNRGERDQHPIESITGLRVELNQKYTFPSGGIPRKDLAFIAATLDDVNAAKVEVHNEVTALDSRVVTLTNRTDTLEDYINNNFGESGDDLNLGSIDFKQVDSLHETHTSTDGQTTFNLGSQYAVGSNKLKVHIDGVLQNVGIDYTEASTTSVELTVPLEAGQIVTFEQDHILETTSPIHETKIYDGNKVFEVSPYRIGDHSLSVYLRGLRLTVGDDYEEVDNTHIKLLDSVSIVSGEKVIFRRETHMAGKVYYHDNVVAHETWTQKYNVDVTGITELKLDKPYLPNTGMLYVYINGLMMDEGNTDDYIEADQSTIQFVNELEVGDLVKIVCDPNLSVWSEVFVITKTDQTVLSLSNMYIPGCNDILLYYDGILLEPGDDYTETNQTTITFPGPIDYGSKIKIYKRR